MKDTAKCFILENGEYIETTYADVKKCRKEDTSFHERKFIHLHGMLLELTDEDYREFQRSDRRQRYIKQEALRVNEVSIESVTNRTKGYNAIIADIDIESDIVDKLMLEKLQDCLQSLNTQEVNLINALYFDRKSERQWAKEINVPPTTLLSRRHKLLKKLKKLMEN